MSPRRWLRFGCAVIGGLLTLNGVSAATPGAADLVLYNGKVLTVDKSFSIATAIAVKDGRIVAVGDDDIAKNYQAARSIDLQGRTLMPGFMDTHIHMYALSPRAVDIEKAGSIAEIQEMVRAKAKQLGRGQWITGYGWDEALLAEKRNLLRADLDAAAPNNPVALTRAGGHSIVGNSYALRVAKITRATPDPESGLIERDANGEPNGIIRERNDLYTRQVPKDTWADLRGGYISSLRKLLPLGITSIMEASGSIDDEPVGKGGGSESGFSLLTYRRLRQVYDEIGDQLPRIALYIAYPGAERLRAFAHRTGYGDERVRIGPIGESPIDGGFTGPTAWTLADYKGQPGFRGTTFLSEAQVTELVNTSAGLGWQLGLHTIGDAAIVQAVDIYSEALRSVGTRSDHRWFLDHFTVMPPAATMEKMAANAIMIAQQPNFTYNLEGRYAATLDDWRLRHNNSVGTPANKYGIFVALGSDNLPIDPRVGLYAAVTRKGMSGKVHGPEEAVSIEQAIRMYTANGPYLTWEEGIKGTLEPGKLADMIVLDSDPLTIAAADLLEMQVDLTIIGGKIVYDRNARATE